MKIGIGFVVRKNRKWHVFRYYTANPIKAVKMLFRDIKYIKLEDTRCF